jgi:septal ring factor EnvC (AmiA/AmiB activator)
MVIVETQRSVCQGREPSGREKSKTNNANRGALKGFVFVSKVALSIGVLFFLSPLLHAAQVEKELEGIKKKIESEKQGIRKVKKKEGSILQSLERIDEELERKNRELKRVNSKLESILVDLQKKEEEVGRLGSSLQARGELLQRRARALYRWQRGGSPFVLLNGGFSVAELMQRKHYLGLTLAYDRELVERLREESGRQEAIKKELTQRRAELDGQRQALVEIKESIRLEREKKKEVLLSLRREKEVHVSALKELEQAASRLQKMIDEINRKSVAKADGSPAGIGFEMLRGKLEYPVRGEVMNGFGKTRHPEFSSEFFRKGIDIQAPLGEEIKAVERGKVIFADRFSGYGKMLIIDHGERYYTIYAHLSGLLKKTGETVQKGESIALVGDSDSLAGARLYFEIRKDGKPLDPMPWFKKR